MNLAPTFQEPRLFDAGSDALLFEETALARRFTASGSRPAAWMGSSDPAIALGYKRDGAVAIVAIEGPLDQRGGWWWDGYDTITRRVVAALGDPQVGAVLLVIDSPGGVVAGCWEAVRTMRAAAKASGKPILVYVDEMACSAGYALACAAGKMGRIVLPRAGIVGSIGVIATATSYADALEKEGIRVAVLSTGKRKADGHPALPLSKEALERMQARIDEYGRQFFALVAEARPLTAANIKALEADCFVGQAAVDAQLADQVGTLADALALARSLAPSTAVAIKAATDTTPTGETMKTVLEALGLHEGATEAEACAVAKTLTTTSHDLLAITGGKTPEVALGTVRGWAQTAQAYDAMVKERAAEQKAAREARVEALFKAALEAGKRTPAQIEAARRSITAGILVLDTDARIDAYQAEIEASPVVVPGAAETRPEKGQGVIGGKSWGEMKPAERAQLRRDNPEAARALKKAHDEAEKTKG